MDKRSTSDVGMVEEVFYVVSRFEHKNFEDQRVQSFFRGTWESCKLAYIENKFGYGYVFTFEK